MDTKAEVNQFQVLVSVYQNVLGLYISVYNIFVMQISDSLSNSVQKLFCLILF